jgi:SAM-dependent methyltransferase
VESLPSWAPRGVDLSTPSAARMYDYYLGGAHNFGVDRELARKVIQFMPDMPLIAQANRAFLHRAVRYLAAEGVHQFVDIGSGIPTVGNVHETARSQTPDSRVLYVDHDPVAVAHSELILTGNPDTKVLEADLRRPADIFDSAQLAELIDLTQPVAVLMVAVLHFISDAEHPEAAIRQFGERLAPGSCLVIAHATGDSRKSAAEQAAGLYRSAADSMQLRTRDQVRGLFTGWELVDPGLVWAPEWRPIWSDEVRRDPAASCTFAGVGRRSERSAVDVDMAAGKRA